MNIKEISVGGFKVANNLPLTLIAGPCQIESKEHAIDVAEFLVNMTKELGINFIFKSSFDKANRSSATGKRGVGLDNALNVFASIKEKFNIPTLTDIHNEEQCRIVAPYIDILQIPAFLCRQTDLLQAAAETGKIVNVKKGQFLAPQDVKYIVQKMEHFGNDKVMLTDRGTCFGYHNLVSDMRALPIMAETGCPIVFDATHSVQQPGGMSGASGGDRRFVQTLATAAIAIGVAAVFIETHPDPDNAPSDGPCMIKLDDMPRLITRLMQFDRLAKE